MPRRITSVYILFDVDVTYVIAVRIFIKDCSVYPYSLCYIRQSTTIRTTKLLDFLLGYFSNGQKFEDLIELIKQAIKEGKAEYGEKNII